jgi:hypothetical protein
MKYVFRITTDLKMKLDAVAPPQAHRRSGFIREALVNFLSKAKQPLVDRPHLRGRQKKYIGVCAILNQDELQAIKAVYSDVSVSVVIQAAVASELRKPRYRMTGLQDTKSTDATKKNTDADPSSGFDARELKASCC